MTLIWVGVAPTFYKMITTGSCGVWLKSVYLLFNQNIWLFIPVLVCLAFLFVRLLKKSISSKTFQVHWFFAIAFGFVVLYCHPPFDYAIIFWEIDYRHLFSAWLVMVLASTLWWMIKLIIEKERNKTQVSHDEVPGFSLDNNRVIQHTDPVVFYADSIVGKLKNTKFSKDEAFAIGITSEWGAGKTTFLDLLSNRIKEEGFAEIVLFNPWMCQSPEQLTRDFFSSLRHQLSDKYPELSNPIKKYARYLGAISVPVHRIAKIKFNNLAIEKSLYKMKLELSERFSELDKRVVVTIDDLDRLDSDEVFEVLRLIRNTASLSNIVYLVAYDKSYIIKVLENKNISSPSAYLEKIFQLEIQLPIVQEGQVWKVFVDDLRDQLPEGFDIGFVSRDKELVEEVLNTYRRAKRFARLLSLSYHYHSRQESLHELDKNDILLLDLLHMDDKKVYDILSFKPKEILELNHEIWIYDEHKSILLSDGSVLNIRETTNKILKRLWGEDDSELGQYSIRREECLEEYFTLNVQFSNKDIKAMIDSDDVDSLVSDWYKTGKSLDRMPDKINSYSKERLTEQQRLNLVLGILSYYYVSNSFDILIKKVDEMVSMLKGRPKKMIEWFDTKMNDKCDYIKFSMIAIILVRSGRINEEDSKNLIEKMIDRLFDNKKDRARLVLNMLNDSDLSKVLNNFRLFGYPILALIAFNRIVSICQNETNRPTIDAFCAEYFKNEKDIENQTLKRIFDNNWKRVLCIIFNNCVLIPHETNRQYKSKKKSTLKLMSRIKATSKEISSECFDSGKKLHEKREYHGALANYTEAILIRPDYAEAYYNRGEVYYSIGEYNDAIADYTEAIRINPDYVEAYYARGVSYGKIGESEKQIEDYREVGRISPDFSKAHHLSFRILSIEFEIIGKKRALANKNEKAIAYYVNEILKRPNDAKAYNNLADAFCYQEEFEKALPHANKAIELNPNEWHYYNTRCKVYIGLEQWDKAMQDVQKILELNQRDGDTKTIKLPEEMITQIKEALKAQNDNINNE